MASEMPASCPTQEPRRSPSPTPHVSSPSRETHSETVEIKTEIAPAMELTETFHGDPGEFDMSFEDLAESNQHDQLYADLTGESTAHLPGDADDNNQGSNDRPSEEMADQVRDAEVPASLPSPVVHIKVETTSASPSHMNMFTTGQHKSPERMDSTKPPSFSKKPACSTGTKRSSQTQTFSWNDILHVQNLIERCLQQHLSKNDIVVTLQVQAKVDPSFTAVVWQKLEEQNPAFFRAYTMQLQLKEQITAFNFLVSQQKEMMAKASGNAAFLSFLSSSDNRKNQRATTVPTSRTSRMIKGSTARGPNNLLSPNPHSSSSANAIDMMHSSTTHPFSLTSPLPLPSPMKTDLDTHAFFS